METQLHIIGFVLILLALAHIIFPKYFKWKDNLKPLTLINRQMMHIHTLFIALTVFLMGLLCLFHSTDLVTTSIGKSICLGLAFFWGLRLFIQFFGYSKKLWKGLIFETRVHIIFSILWTYFCTVFLYIYIKNP